MHGSRQRCPHKRSRMGAHSPHLCRRRRGPAQTDSLVDGSWEMTSRQSSQKEAKSQHPCHRQAWHALMAPGRLLRLTA